MSQTCGLARAICGRAYSLAEVCQVLLVIRAIRSSVYKRLQLVSAPALETTPKRAHWPADFSPWSSPSMTML